MLGAVFVHRSEPGSPAPGGVAASVLASARRPAEEAGSYQLPGLKGGMKNGSSGSRVAGESSSQRSLTSSSVGVSVTATGDPRNSSGSRASPNSANTR